MGISAFTGSDLPIVLAFAAQLLKANPDALLTAMAEKGGMVEFETKIADAFDRVVLSKKEREREETQQQQQLLQRDENESESENETGAK
jgi:ornithine cyclodeaminase/alanine dehydrogenase-like protein (mu-crystallin family)